MTAGDGLDVAEREGKGQQLQGPAQDLTRGQGDRLVGEPAEVGARVREAEAVTDDGNEASADAQQLALAEAVPGSDDHHDADQPDDQSADDLGAELLLAQDEQSDDHRGERGEGVDEPASTAEMWVSP